MNFQDSRFPQENAQINVLESMYGRVLNNRGQITGSFRLPPLHISRRWRFESTAQSFIREIGHGFELSLEVPGLTTFML